MYQALLQHIEQLADLNFPFASERIVSFVDTCPDFLGLVQGIGTIPEAISHDSTQEKLYAKASDAVLARAFRELGLSAVVLKERSNAADVQAASRFHNYTLVADAKAFRMSRTAKNQKDFKVSSLSGWRGDADYAVLCAPIFQYPTSRSQVYEQAIANNVCLFSWEHILFLLENHVVETPDLSLAPLWQISGDYARRCFAADMKNCFLPVINDAVIAFAGSSDVVFYQFLSSQITALRARGCAEQAYLQMIITNIQHYTREQAISELIRSKKLEERIAQINRYTAGITLW